jgi:hypothetical protein
MISNKIKNWLVCLIFIIGLSVAFALPSISHSIESMEEDFEIFDSDFHTLVPNPESGDLNERAATEKCWVLICTQWNANAGKCGKYEWKWLTCAPIPR